MINQKDRIEAAIRHIQTSVDIDPWAMELAVDALKAQGTCEDAVSRQTLQKELALYPIDDVTSEDEAGYNRAINDVQKMVLHLPSTQPQSTMGQVNDTAQSTNDCISRRAAIELIERMKPYHQNADDIAEMIANMPSAQPELTQNLHNACTDLISRQEVIKLLDEAWVDGHEYQGWLHDEVNRLPSAQPEPLKITIDHTPTADELERIKHAMRNTPVIVFPSAQPEPSEITDEQAIMHLQSTGWMQNHDREMYESGLREQLADDSDSYDALLPSAQPEIIACGDCKHWICHDRRCGYWNHGVKPLEWCCHAERRTDE